VEDEENNKGLIRAAAMRMDEAQMDDTNITGSTRSEETTRSEPSSWLDFIKNWLRHPSTSEIFYAVAATAVLVLVVGGAIDWLSPAPAVEVALWAERGEAATLAQAPAASALRLNIDLTTLPQLQSYRVELVDARGKLINSSDLKAAGSQLSWSLPAGYAGGQYWVRLRDPGQPGEILREFGLVLR
jgi:hypothetical protein